MDQLFLHFTMSGASTIGRAISVDIATILTKGLIPGQVVSMPREDGRVAIAPGDADFRDPNNDICWLVGVTVDEEIYWLVTDLHRWGPCWLVEVDIGKYKRTVFMTTNDGLRYDDCLGRLTTADCEIIRGEVRRLYGDDHPKKQ